MKHILSLVVVAELALVAGISGAKADLAQDIRNAAQNVNIIGGTEVPAGDPVAASTVIIVGTESAGSFLCTGSIIAPDMIVTAGHCLGTNGDAAIKIGFSPKHRG